MIKQAITVPFLDLQSQFCLIRDEVQEALDRVVGTQQFILGPEVESLEQEIAAYSQCRHGIGVSSGTDALLVSLMALEIKPGHEVITSPYTFFATVGSIVRLGAKPVFVDIDPSTYNLDPTCLEAAISNRTRAIIPIHLFGQMANMRTIMEVARNHSLYVIEDAAQSIGAEYQGQRAGGFGHLGCFSFYPSKNLGGFGDGGMVVSNDPDLARRIKLLRNHGQEPKYFSKLVGGNFRLDAVQAAVLRVKLRHLDAWISARQCHADKYRHLFREAGLIIDDPRGIRLELDRGVIMPAEEQGVRHVYNQFVIRCARRDALKSYLEKHGICTEIYYPVPMHMQESLSSLGYRVGDFSISEMAAVQSLALPIYPELTETMQALVVQTIAEFYCS